MYYMHHQRSRKSNLFLALPFCTQWLYSPKTSKPYFAYLGVFIMNSQVVITHLATPCWSITSKIPKFVLESGCASKRGRGIFTKFKFNIMNLASKIDDYWFISTVIGTQHQSSLLFWWHGRGWHCRRRCTFITVTWAPFNTFSLAGTLKLVHFESLSRFHQSHK